MSPKLSPMHQLGGDGTEDRRHWALLFLQQASADMMRMELGRLKAIKAMPKLKSSEDKEISKWNPQEFFESVLISSDRANPPRFIRDIKKRLVSARGPSGKNTGKPENHRGIFGNTRLVKIGQPLKQQALKGGQLPRVYDSYRMLSVFHGILPA
jgi:hypothetical protein